MELVKALTYFGVASVTEKSKCTIFPIRQLAEWLKIHFSSTIT
jgi:hypothetical protein